MYITFYLGLSLPFFDFMAFATTIYIVIYPNFPNERLVYCDSLFLHAKIASLALNNDVPVVISLGIT